MVNHNLRIARMVYVKGKQSLNYFAMFHPELLETIWTGLVVIKYKITSKLYRRWGR